MCVSRSAAGRKPRCLLERGDDEVVAAVFLTPYLRRRLVLTRPVRALDARQMSRVASTALRVTACAVKRDRLLVGLRLSVHL